VKRYFYASVTLEGESINEVVSMWVYWWP